MNPWLVRHAFLPIHERLMRRHTFEYYRDMERSQFWPPERLEQLQLDKLRSLLAVFLKNPAYARLSGKSARWRPGSLDDLCQLPLLDKTTLSAMREELVNRDVEGGPIKGNTGGSSGQPLLFYMDRRRQAADKAARMRSQKWWGKLPGDREAYIWGSPVELSKQDRLKNIRDRLTNEMLLSAFDLSATSVGRFVDRLARFKPKCLFGYPSSIALMCRLARNAGLNPGLLDVRVVFATAEVLYEEQRQTVSQALGGAPVANGYGSREGGFIAHECPHGRFHITSESVIVEFLKDGLPVGDGQDGEIVVTHLDNHAMPFIRYQTGDIGQPSAETCPCGRGLGVMKVVKGRSTDFVVTPDGRWLHGLALIYVVRELPGIEKYQIIQHTLHDVEVRLVADGQFPPDGVEHIRQGIGQRMGQDVAVDVHLVSHIAPEPSGKLRYVVSTVARQREALL